MRSALILFLSVALAQFATGAEKAIPQDPALSAKRSSDWLEWNRRTLVGAYEKVGKKDPRWDAKAREAMEKAARMFSLQVDPEVAPEEVHAPAKAAVDAGCDDPMVLYLLHRTDPASGSAKPEELARLWKDLAVKLGASKYPAERRAVCHQLAAGARLGLGQSDEASRKVAKDHYDAALALLTEGESDDARGPYWEDRWCDMLAGAIAGYRAAGLDALRAYERVDAAIAKAPKLEALRLKLRGRFWTGYGWEARTKAFAPAVPQGGFAKFEDRLTKAREALEKSYSIQPDPGTARMLLDIEKSIGGDRKAMEIWFERAMKLDPDNRNACWAKLDWLDPKWHGSWEEMIDFGRACKATGNWRTGITLLAADAHYRFASLLRPADTAKYLSIPEVWADIAPPYDEYIKHHPEDSVALSKYGLLCYRAGRHAQAHELFQRVGDRLTTWTEFPYPPQKSLEAIRDQVAQEAKQAKPAPAPGG